ncbi:uncharacterized protein LOC133331869 [Musca vetustissima]|uniref:uncharacterized protein LOC133331869 n=1 Tax=Musca vetustissima TaxID=27455 RepID=UPI002AB6704C|nr:uncharacterized protein LOC133331869 [Musca vetustissima]
MYKISHFNHNLCYFLRHRVDLAIGGQGDKDEECGFYSIWTFSPKSRWNAINLYLNEEVWCQIPWFPLVYWLVLLISILGSVYSLFEFVTLALSGGKPLSLWRIRKYHVLPQTLLRRCRLLGSFVMFNCWLVLSYAVVSVSPSHMTPWLTTSFLSLACETLTCLIELLMGFNRIDFDSVLALALPIANYWLVCCVRNIFQKAIHTHDLDEVRLWW